MDGCADESLYPFTSTVSLHFYFIVVRLIVVIVVVVNAVVVFVVVSAAALLFMFFLFPLLFEFLLLFVLFMLVVCVVDIVYVYLLFLFVLLFILFMFICCLCCLVCCCLCCCLYCLCLFVVTVCCCCCCCSMPWSSWCSLYCYFDISFVQQKDQMTRQKTPSSAGRKRKRRKVKESDISDLLSPDSPLFRHKRKSGDLLSVSGSLLDYTLSPATPARG